MIHGDSRCLLLNGRRNVHYQTGERYSYQNGRYLVQPGPDEEDLIEISYQVGSHISYHYLTCGRGSVFV